MGKIVFVEQLAGSKRPPKWWVSRRDRLGEPACTITIIADVRLQVYRHIAYPEAWTAYAHGVLSDVVLAAKDLEEAQYEALVLLQCAQARLAESGS